MRPAFLKSSDQYNWAERTAVKGLADDELVAMADGRQSGVCANRTESV